MKFGRLVCAIAAKLSLVFGVAALAARPAEAEGLPAGYTEVGCLVSHGTEYIDSEYTPTKDCRIVLDFAYATDAAAGGTVLGFGAAGNAQSIRLLREQDAKTGVVSYRVNFDDYYPDICYIDHGTALDTDRHVIDVSNGSKTFDGAKIDGVYFEPGKPTDNKILLTKTLQGSLYLFARNQGWNPVGAAGAFATCKIYSCQIYDGTTLKRDFVPCLNAGGEPVLYDLVGQKEYANKGTGKFECETSRPFVEATLTGCLVAEDGQPHGPVLTVTEPTSGYQVEWSTDGETFGSERPTFTEVGEHTVFCRVSADGYTTRNLSATVKLVQPEIYTLAGSDANGASAMNGKGSYGWTDSSGVTTKSHNPSAGKVYVVDRNLILRTPGTAPFTFGGDSLILSGDAKILFKSPDNGVVTIPRLIVAGDAILSNGDGSTLKKLAGIIEIPEFGALVIDGGYDNTADKVRQFEIQSDVSGAGSLWVGMLNDGTKGEPYVKFTGALADFTGKIDIGGLSVMRFETIFTSSLPGDPSEVMADGLTMAGKSALVFETSGEMGFTRGVSFGSGTREIFVAEGETVQIDGLLVGTAGFKKTGAGTLALASVSSGLSGTVTVAEGTLRLCGAAASVLPNAAVEVADGAFLDETGTPCVHDPVLEATLTGVDVVADGQPHSPVLTVTEPAEGWQATWSVDGGDYVSECPTFTEVGEYSVVCKISAEGYISRKLRTTVLIRALRRIVATEAEKTGDWADATVAGDDAYAAIQGVIDACGANEFILVKAGTYLLTNELSFASAELKGVKFRSDDGAGKLARETTLLVGGYPATTNRLVRLAAPGVTVDGFTLTNGYVDASCGGGAYLDDCGADGGLRNCDIVGCTAWHEPFVTSKINKSNLGTGGGAYVYKTGLISNCLFRANTAFAGGAVYLEGTQERVFCAPSAAPRVTACTLVKNQIVGMGTDNAFTGSALASYRTVFLDGSTISSNFCNVTGSGQFSTVGTSGGYLTLSNCVFEANHLGTWKTANLPVVGANNNNYIICAGTTFVREGTVGNIFNNNYGSFVCDGNAMIDCQGSLGGAWKEYRNCLFSGNTNKLCLTGTIKAENCTFVNNLGAIYSDGGGVDASRTNVVVNCLFYDNDNDIYASSESKAKPIALFLSNCCIRASSLDRRAGTVRRFGLLVTNDCNIIYENGMLNLKALGFVAPGEGDFRLREGSVLVDAGMTLGWMDGASDRGGQPRVVGPAPDIGCYERQTGAIDPPEPFVRAVATEADKKDEWSDAYVGLQAAADAACGEPIYVKSGTYSVTEPVAVRNWGVEFIGEGPDTTIVDGGYPARTNRIFTVEAAGVTLSGLTIKNGLAYKQNGGGVYVNAPSFTMTNCVIRDCVGQYGGGLYANVDCHGIVDCVFSNNLADNFGSGYGLGGGAYFNKAATVKKCDFADGEVMTEGGGCYCNNVYAFEGCTFTNNTTQTSGSNQKGGAFYNNGNNAGSFTDCTFSGNYAKENGSATFLNGPCTFVGCRVMGNRGGANGGIHMESATALLTVDGCTFSHNGGSTLSSIGAGTGAVITNCVFENRTAEDGLADHGIVGRAKGSGRICVTDCKFLNVYGNGIIGDYADADCCVFSNITMRFVFGRDTNRIRNCLFTGSPAAVKLGNCTYENCSFVGNVGGAAVAKKNTEQTSPSLTNCVFWANTADSNYRGTMGLMVHSDDFNATNRVKMANCVLQTNEETDTHAPNMCDADKTGKTTELTAVVVARGPKFVDPENGDWHLRRNSPLRDAGLTLVGWMTEDATDLDGKPRRISSDGKAYPDSLPDIGCYECDIPKPGLLLQVR